MPCAWVANKCEEVSFTGLSDTIPYILFVPLAIDFMHTQNSL